MNILKSLYITSYYVKELQKETGWAENGVIADSW